MRIFLLLYLVLLFCLLFYLMYKIIRWIIRKKVRAYWALALLGIFLLTKIINHVFFTKMEFIQSKVYLNLYLVKNEIKDRDSLNNIIKERIMLEINNNSDITKKIYPKNTHEAPYATLAFYTYTKSSKLSMFQDYGTAYFIDNEEDLGGMVVEDLSMYQNYKLATYNIRTHKKDTTLYYGVLAYYKQGYLVKTDTLITKSNLTKTYENK